MQVQCEQQVAGSLLAPEQQLAGEPGAEGTDLEDGRVEQRLTAEAQAAKPIAAADKMRTALLAAVSHDLRTPLASAKAAVTSLRSRDVDWADEDHDELLATADESLDRLTHLVDNLLDMSRLQAGALSYEIDGLRDIVENAP